MERNFLVNSPLEKGDKGGCDAEMEEENKKQPLPPFIKGEYCGNFVILPVSCG
jgi:hypothetical protein